MTEMIEVTLSQNVCKEIDHWLTKYPATQKSSAVVAALRAVQEENGGWLTPPLIEAVARYLELPKIAVYEVVTFYDMLELKPRGKHLISVCTNVSCQLRGSDALVEHLQNRLNIRLGDTTADGLFTVKEVECMAACCGAPMCQIDNKEYVENLTPEKLDQLLEQLKTAVVKEEGGHGGSQ